MAILCVLSIAITIVLARRNAEIEERQPGDKVAFRKTVVHVPQPR